MIRIGLLSDTHGYMDDSILHHFVACDEIWHAGDIGSLEVLDRLRAVKPVRAVWGNIDDHRMRLECPEHQRWMCEGVDTWITHIGGRPGKYATPVAAAMKERPPRLFICGHSHLCLVQMDKKHHTLYMNPGAAGVHGFHQVRTMLRFTIDGADIRGLEVIELGPRVRRAP